ncbi:autotransporter domain-containing protein [Parasphingorhabdus sp.]|uniref:autotransporter domain-containing protein n=1 Tax=Parasphingorhabdus sp. TaxID=2709688 RepID=UPI003A5C840E
MTSRRQGILQGASILAICVAVPVAAQTTPINGGQLLPNPLTTLSTDVNAGGVTATGADPTAAVVDLDSGEVAQISEDTPPVSLTNGGTFAITAEASGTGTATAVVGNIGPDVLATGTFQSALTQKHLLADVDGATWDASATLVNTGSARIRAIASSTDGDASASVLGGISQVASVETKGRTATAVMDNDGGTVEISAAASGAGTVTAAVGTGGETGSPAIKQFVFSSKSPDATTSGSGTILNSGNVSVQAIASPVATGAESASASITGGVVQQVQATGRGNSDMAATVTNDGSFDFVSSAGVGDGSVQTATAFATEVLTQRIQANGGGLKSDSVEGWNDVLAVEMTNNGDINLTTNAVATGTATSLIGVQAIPADFSQYGALYGSTYGEGPGLNADYLNFSAPSPILSEHGVISQRGQANGWGDDLSEVTMTNAVGASINIAASATATNPAGDAIARNTAARLVAQGTQANGTGNDTATADMTNDGNIGVNAGSTAASTAEGGNAFAVSTVTSAIQQTAEVTGPTKYREPVDGGGTVEVAYVNIGELAFTNGATGVVDVRSNATATAADGGAEAHSYVEAGLVQSAQVDGGTPKISFENRNDFNVAATSVATGTAAFATAGTANLVLDAGFPIDEGRLPTAHDVVGVQQILFGAATDARFDNSGDLGVTATATANGGAGGAGALASALGYGVTGEPVGVTVTNSGNLTVSATATTSADADATRLANALATGMGFYANYEALPELPDIVHGGGDSGGNGNGPNGNGGRPDGDEEEEPAIPTYALTGSVANTGTITVSASSSGDRAFPEGELLVPVSIVPGQTLAIGATAVGVEFVSATNNVSMQNSGTIDVSAVTDGAQAQAFGVRVLNYEAPVIDTPPVMALLAVAPDVFTLSNLGGTIRARTSTDGGASFKRGVAIDTSNAPNMAVINLEGAASGNGVIYGNIDIAAADEIHVRNGETVFDGIVNPDGTKEGSLAVHSGGTLYLVNQPHGAVSTTGTPTVNSAYDGAAGVNVNSFAVEDGATLALQLASFPTTEGSFPTVTANTVTLGATSGLEVRPSSWNGLYNDNYYFDNVIKASNAAALTGTFDPTKVVTNTGTPLLQVATLYNQDTDGGDVDITIQRVGFGDVAGLTVNEASAGDGIENVYAPTLTGPFAGLLGNLFLLNAADYPDALSQLSGDQYAGYLQGLRNHSMQLNSLVSDQLDCAISIDGPQKCSDRDGEVRLWMLGSYNDVSVDTDVNSPGYDSENWSALLGADYTTGNFTIGAFGGYRDSRMDFNRNNGRIKSDGWQLGAFGAYDVGSFYIRGIGSYSDLNGESRRDISILSTQGTALGQPDATITSLYGEAGARVNVGAKSWLTPFAALDYTKVKLKSFVETGVPGANLGFNSQSEDQTSLLAGLKWAGNFGGIVPEAKVAWRYDLNSSLVGVNAYFDDAPAGSDFRVFAPQTSRSSVVAGFSLAAMLGEQFTGRVGYQGRFNSEVKDHAVYGSLTYRFGGHTPPPAPAPAPAPTAAPAPPPPPPPAPQVVQCNTGPYIVFFDWDRSDVTPEASTVLDNAYTAYGNCNSVPIMVAGHADRSGAATYNVDLSQRRANAVRGYLTTRGIADETISTQAFGESRNRVPTADGVREPQNRRVEITYGPGSGF